ncbi:MAG TPA: hypothetical protein PKI14_09030 [Fervidobacterium sp.]|nr:hypothetical protein [Fervidobacterium sp.]HPT54198.1 hypothetical protein [Fervidobacterium sp.]HPZ18053.1 hypothetical protein [Fervidobacterium sp.]HQE49324.1 hypothetical protein [Fervidobacterium sp.]HUM43077.1 hypothetical protein [Fervidobacterium sp.]
MQEKESKVNVLLMEGVAIFFVMFVHSGTPNKIYAFFSYGLSSLIFARGYQWRERTFKELIKSRIQLLKTYYFAGLINSLAFLLVVPSKFLTTSKWNYFLNFLIGRLDKLDQIPITIVPLWFFLMLFFAELMYWLLKKNGLILALAVISSILLRLFPHEPLPFKLDTAFSAIPFFVIGSIWKEKRYQVRLLDFILSVLGLVFISQTNGDISWNNQWFGKNGLIAFLGEILAMFVIIYLADAIKTLKLDKFFYKISFNSLFIVSYHFLLGNLISLPFILISGNLSDPMSVLHSFWYIHFPLVLILVFVCIQFIPQRVRSFLIGDFRRMKKGVRNS